jgi:metal-responsive CopG/Arc/MetJ family transcriptional regulator
VTHTDVRTHVILPGELVRRVDALVGQRRRSRFFAEAVSEKLARIELLALAEAAAGSLPAGLVPEWDSSESAAQWVHDLRQLDNERLDALDRLRERAESRAAAPE